MKKRIIALVAVLALAVVCPLLLSFLAHRTSDEVILSYVGRSEVHGFRLVHFALRVPSGSEVYVPLQSVNGFEIGIRDDRMEHVVWQSMRVTIATNGTDILVQPDPTVHIRLTTMTPSASPGTAPASGQAQAYPKLKDMFATHEKPLALIGNAVTSGPPLHRLGHFSKTRYGPETNLVITILEPDLPEWRLELETLQYHLGPGAWLSKARRAWRTKQLSALKSQVTIVGRIRSELISSSHGNEAGTALEVPEALSATRTIVDAADATRRAVEAANQAAFGKHGVKPFDETETTATSNGQRWMWHGRVGYGKGDLEARVFVSPWGTVKHVTVQYLIVAPTENSR